MSHLSGELKCYQNDGYMKYSLLLLLLPSVAFSLDSDYATITEVKSWDTKNDIYLSIGHACGGIDTKRYHLGKDKSERFSVLLTAFTAGLQVNVNYTCTGDYPEIHGVRTRK